jgi:hypothetical protein
MTVLPLFTHVSCSPPPNWTLPFVCFLLFKKIVFHLNFDWLEKKKEKNVFFFVLFCFHKISDPVSLISLYSDCVTKRKKKTHWRLNPSPVNMSRFEIFQFFGFPPLLFYFIIFCPIFLPICLFIFSSKFPVVKKKEKQTMKKIVALQSSLFRVCTSSNSRWIFQFVSFVISSYFLQYLFSFFFS